MTHYGTFMLRDLADTLLGVCIFPLFIVIPGYVLGIATNIFSFRQQKWVTKTALGALLSVSTVPIISYLLGRLASYTAAPLLWLVYAIVWLVFLVRCAKSWSSISLQPIAVIKDGYAPFVIFTVWTGIAIFSIIDVQFNETLFFPLILLLRLSAPDHGNGCPHTHRFAAGQSLLLSGLPGGTPISLFLELDMQSSRSAWRFLG